MNIESINIRILIINNDFVETDTIKLQLEKDMRVPWSLVHCVNIEEARSRINKADLVILNLKLEGIATPREIFGDIEHIVHGIPIIVLTGEDEHNLATYVMERGAADKMIRGKFGRLVDAIEFALIRQKHKTDAKDTADKTLSDSEDRNAADLRRSRDRSMADQERQKQILRMFSGDYAVDQQDKTNT